MPAHPIDTPAPVRDLDWEPARAREAGEAALDLWTELLTTLRDLPVSRMQPADEVAAAVRVPIPAEGMTSAEMIEVLRPLVLEQAVYPGHPGFLAYISGGGTVPGAAADLIAAGLNANPGGWALSGGVTEFEIALMRWLASRFGMPEGAGGLVTAGGATSNITALKAARDAALPDVRTVGLAGRPVAFYASTESHATILEAADMIGAGEASVRLIGTDVDLRMRVDLLEEAIAADRAASVTPIAVVGTAGTTGPGTIDPLPAIADVCEREGIWFHVDAAYGGAAVFSTPLRPLLDGIGRADTITFDPHKWLSVPLTAAVLLAREPDRLLSAFVHEAAYIREVRERTRGGENLGSYSQAWSRSFSALKIWASLAGHGTDAYDRRLAHDVELARYLAARVEAEPTLELGIEPVLPIVCFRIVRDGVAAKRLDDLNERVMEAIRREGRVFPSNAEIGGRYFLRACISNFRTEAEQMDELVEAAIRLAKTLERSQPPSASDPAQ